MEFQDMEQVQFIVKNLQEVKKEDKSDRFM